MTSQRRKPVKRSPEQWQQIMDDYERNDENQADYCKRHALSPSTFHGWRARVTKTDAIKPTSKTTDFIELASPSQAAIQSYWDLELHLGAGVVLRINRARC